MNKVKIHTMKVQTGDLNFDIHSTYTKDLFVRLLKSSQVHYEVKDNYDGGYRVIVPVYNAYGYCEVTKMLDSAIAHTIDM